MKSSSSTSRAERLTFGGKPIGTYKDGLWSRGGVKPSHIMRLFGSMGWDADTFDRLLENGLARLKALSKTQVWSIDAQTFIEHRVARDYGHGRQYFVPVGYWKVEDR